MDRYASLFSEDSENLEEGIASFLGKATGKIKRAAADFKKDFQTASEEEETKPDSEKGPGVGQQIKNKYNTYMSNRDCKKRGIGRTREQKLKQAGLHVDSVGYDKEEGLCFANVKNKTGKTVEVLHFENYKRYTPLFESSLLTEGKIQAIFLKALDDKKDTLSSGTLASVRREAMDIVKQLDADFNTNLTMKLLGLLQKNAATVSAKDKPKDFKDAYNVAANQAKDYFTLNKPTFVKLYKAKPELATHFVQLSIYVYFMNMLLPTITDNKQNIGAANFQKVVDRFSSYYNKYLAPLTQKQPEAAQVTATTAPAGK